MDKKTSFQMLQPFIPTIDFEISQSFYRDLGFEVIYQDDQLNLFKKDQVSFFIQKAYVKDWAENTMLQLYVDDLETFHKHCLALRSTYPMIKVTEIKDVHYGKTFHVLDPAGVLWHMTDPKRK